MANPGEEVRQKNGALHRHAFFLKGDPRVAIEFKWRRNRISRKDRRSLVASLIRLRVNKAYFFCALPDSSRYRRLCKRPVEKYALHERVVGLDLPPEHIRQWEEERKKYMREMPRGKARH